MKMKENEQIPARDGKTIDVSVRRSSTCRHVAKIDNAPRADETYVGVFPIDRRRSWGYVVSGVSCIVVRGRGM